MVIEPGTKLIQVKPGNNSYLIGQIIEIAREDYSNHFIDTKTLRWTRDYLEANFEVIPPSIKPGDTVRRVYMDPVMRQYGGMVVGDTDRVTKVEADGYLSLKKYGDGHKGSYFVVVEEPTPTVAHIWGQTGSQTWTLAYKACSFTDPYETTYQSRIEADLNKLRI